MTVPSAHPRPQIRTHLHSLRTRLFEYIYRTLDKSQISTSSFKDRPSTSAAATSAYPESHLPALWQLVRDKFLAMFLLDDAAMGGGSAAKSRSREELMQLVIGLHHDLSTQVRGRTLHGWDDMRAFLLLFVW